MSPVYTPTANATLILDKSQKWSNSRTSDLQKAQLPLRNRASAMHFFVAKLLSIAVMTYSYVYHLRNLRPANLLRTQRMNFSMRSRHVRMTRDPTSCRLTECKTARISVLLGINSDYGTSAPIYSARLLASPHHSTQRTIRLYYLMSNGFRKHLVAGS